MAPKKSSTTKKTTTTTHRQVETERRAEVAEQEQAAAERASDEITETPAEGQTAETRSRSRSRHPPETHNVTVNDIAIHYAMDEKYRARQTGMFVTTAAAPAADMASNGNEMMTEVVTGSNIDTARTGHDAGTGTGTGHNVTDGDGTGGDLSAEVAH